MRLFLAVVISIVSAPAVPLWAQEAAEAAPANPQARFDAVMAEYKEAVREIEQKRNEFQAADAATRQQINRDLEDLVAKTQQIVDRMVDTGLEVYRAAPEENQQIAEMLVAVAHHRVVGRVIDPSGNLRDGGDQFETALPLAQALIDGGSSEKLLPVWGFVCAYMTNDFDLAERYLQLAQDNGALSDPSLVSDQADQDFMERLVLPSAGSIDTRRQLWQVEQAIRAAEAQADDLPRVKFATTQGDIVLELFENEAPIAVANFISLVKLGYYDGLTFHRVLPGFMAQGGCPDGTGAGGPGYSIRCECYQPNYRKHFRGTLSMAHAGRDTGGSQFFLTFVPTEHLDGKHTVFGRVLEGFEVLGKLQKRDPSSRGPLPEPDRIVKAQVLRDRGHAYEFEKLPAR